MYLDIQPENEGVQEKKKGVMIMINYHSDNYIFLADKNMYFRHRVCFNGTVCASDLVLSEVENRGQDIRRIARKKAGREL